MDLIMSLLLEYKYLIMVPATLVFGPPTSLAAGVLLRTGYLDIVPTVLALGAGELFADVLWYWLGRKYGERFVGRFGKYLGITRRSIETAKSLFSRHQDIIIFTSKITAGLGFAIPIFFTAGLSRVPFKRYMMLNIAGQFFWTTGLVAIGYFLGHIYLQVGNIFEKVALFGLVVIIIISLVSFGRHLRSQFDQPAS